MKEGNEMIGNECRQEVKEQENSECKFKLYIQCKCNYASIQINSIQFKNTRVIPFIKHLFKGKEGGICLLVKEK